MRWVRVLLATPWVLVGTGVVTLVGAALLFAHINGSISLPGLQVASAGDSRRGLDSGLRAAREVAPLPHNNYGYGQYNLGQTSKTVILGVSEAAPMKGIPTRYITGADGNALNGNGNTLYGNSLVGAQTKNAYNSLLLGVDDRMRDAQGRGMAPPYMSKGFNSGAAAAYASGFLVQRKPNYDL